MFFKRAMAMNHMSKRLFSTLTPTIKTQHMMQMARVEVHLPQMGNCWFFVRPDENVAKFRDEVNKEDQLVKTVELFEEVPAHDGTGSIKTPVPDSESLYTKLLDPDNRLFLHLNGMEYKFDQKGCSHPEEILKDNSTWYTQCRAANLSKMHSTTLNTIIRQLEKNLPYSQETLNAETVVIDTIIEEEPAKKGVRGKKKASSSDTVSVSTVCDIFVEQTKFFEDAIVREQVFQLRALRLATETQLNVMEKQKLAIEKQEDNKHKLRVAAMTTFFTAQFLVGGYAIFFVDWLGWDLVEPITYTVGQGSFVLGLLFVMRNRKAGLEYSELKDHYLKVKREQYWLVNHQFDIKRHEFLKLKL